MGMKLKREKAKQSSSRSSSASAKKQGGHWWENIDFDELFSSGPGPSYDISISRRTAQFLLSASGVILSTIFAMIFTDPGWLLAAFLSGIFTAGLAGLLSLLPGRATFRYRGIVTVTGSIAVFFCLLFLLKSDFIKDNFDNEVKLYIIQDSMA